MSDVNKRTGVAMSPAHLGSPLEWREPAIQHDSKSSPLKNKNANETPMLYLLGTFSYHIVHFRPSSSCLSKEFHGNSDNHAKGLVVETMVQRTRFAWQRAWLGSSILESVEEYHSRYRLEIRLSVPVFPSTNGQHQSRKANCFQDSLM